MNCVQRFCLLMLYCFIAAQINEANIQKSTNGNGTKLTELTDDIKLYLKKLYELNDQFPGEIIKGKDKIDEIEQNARKIIEAINHIRNSWNVEDYERNMAIICGMS
ncbi:Uncharacterized protein BM_BM4 [Brugia malayi]|uniref:Bm4 n=2 Tax=Brugia TaxID=6278 RepID=A0A0J9XLR8_BRUMA|nr:Uncharacterized protein BM_BM4 [Brugia malayi]CDP90604.1 Bm4 [Brugia malayi]VDN81855.1 unnamed protein product [Brugia pahangi]VIO99494.1 Uncharacterized protein BM_BM4 [Brugia malayi]